MRGNLDFILRFIAFAQFTNPSILAKGLGLHPVSIIRALTTLRTKYGYVHVHSLPHDLRSYYLITHTGAQYLRTQYDYSIPAPLPRSRIPIRQLHHDLDVQYIALGLLRHFTNLDNYFTFNRSLNNSSYRPDAIITGTDGKQIYLEVELSLKSTRALLYKWHEIIISQIDSGAMVFIVCGDPRINAQYLNLYDEIGLPVYADGATRSDTPISYDPIPNKSQYIIIERSDFINEYYR